MPEKRLQSLIKRNKTSVEQTPISAEGVLAPCAVKWPPIEATFSPVEAEFLPAEATFMPRGATFLLVMATYLPTRATFWLRGATFWLATATFLLPEATFLLLDATFLLPYATFLHARATFLLNEEKFSFIKGIFLPLESMVSPCATELYPSQRVDLEVQPKMTGRYPGNHRHILYIDIYPPKGVKK